jgi:hypothetical protein
LLPESDVLILTSLKSDGVSMKLDEKEWSAHLAAAQEEGCSLRSYAKRHGLSAKSLYYRQNKLNAAAEIGDSSPRSKFVALRLSETVDAQRWTVDAQRCCESSLALPSGMRLEISGLPSPEWLIAVGRAAQGER